mgnify:CR=1 FL=1
MEPKKNPNIDSEDIKSRSVYVLSGLVLVIAFILCLVGMIMGIKSFIDARK